MNRNGIEDINESIKTLSHDLKSPMITIYGISEMVEDLVKKAPISEDELNAILSYLEKIKYTTKSCSSLINNILRIYVTGESVLEKQYIQFRILLSEVLKETFFEDKDITFKFESGLDEEIYVNVVEIKEVLANLINNSIKYRKQKAIIKFGRKNISEEGYACFYIEDNGIGMNKKNVKLFNSFLAKDDNNGYNKSLGLSITKRFIHRNKGKIYISSEGKNKGLVVYLTLPRSKDKI